MSAFIGNQFLPGEENERTSYYNWYYFSTQIGSIIATSLMPIVLNYSSILLFVVFAVMLIVGCASFFFIKKYNYSPSTPGIYIRLLNIIKTALFTKKSDAPVSHIDKYDYQWLDKALIKYSIQEVSEVKTAVKVLVIFLPLPFFWAIYFQVFSVWIEMANTTNNVIFGITIPTSEITALNPLFDLFLIPLFSKLLYPFFEKKLKFPLTPLIKMGSGLFFTFLAVIASAIVQLAINYTSVSIAWMIPQFLLISIAEILLSITAVDFAYSEAPKRMKGFVTACWFLTLAFGNLLVSVLGLIQTSHFFIESMLIADFILMITGIFIGMSFRYRYTKKEESYFDSEYDEHDSNNEISTLLNKDYIYE
eukprot:TRINITY_DN1352_c0_g1_i2.p1 TRINITY_DN1352_c0_g1~~TRINITY_DN1352_c0_g1_i2.p1  ORF type:complete len:363 (+),score=83.41 TRINITY_DN1352_c0_g1_i2:427-1515(+)